MDPEPSIVRAKKKITICFEHCGHKFVIDWNDREELTFHDITSAMEEELARHGDEIMKIDKTTLTNLLIINYSF